MPSSLERDIKVTYPALPGIKVGGIRSRGQRSSRRTLQKWRSTIQRKRKRRATHRFYDEGDNAFGSQRFCAAFRPRRKCRRPSIFSPAKHTPIKGAPTGERVLYPARVAPDHRPTKWRSLRRSPASVLCLCVVVARTNWRGTGAARSLFVPLRSSTSARPHVLENVRDGRSLDVVLRRAAHRAAATRVGQGRSLLITLPGRSQVVDVVLGWAQQRHRRIPECTSRDCGHLILEAAGGL
jgi:hypothetical protein